MSSPKKPLTDKQLARYERMFGEKHPVQDLESIDHPVFNYKYRGAVKVPPRSGDYKQRDDVQAQWLDLFVKTRERTGKELNWRSLQLR